MPPPPANPDVGCEEKEKLLERAAGFAETSGTNPGLSQAHDAESGL